MKPYSSSFILSGIAFTSLAHAGWREDVGYHHLLSYSGYYLNPLPSGSGVGVEQVENPNGSGYYMPNTASPQFTGKTFTNISNSSSGVSDHASTVASYFFSNINSLTPDTDTIGVRNANDFINNFLLGVTVGSTSAKVISHTYIVLADEIDPVDQATFNALIARFDYFSIDSAVVNVIGMNNGNSSNVPPVWGSAYNCISVGRSDGLHSHGFTHADFANSGRQKPDIVGPLNTTSWNTGAVSGAAKLIYDKANSSGNADASHPDTIKACLLTGATKEEFPSWSQTSSLPLDTTYGAGELNIYNSYRIIELAESSTGSVFHRGWARNNVASSGNPAGQTRTYTFTTPNYPAGSFDLSATLIWQRPVSNITYTYSSLANLKLALLDSGGSQIQSSDSSLDNVEHIWNTSLQPNTTYSLQVTSSSGSSNFSLAWRADYVAQAPVGGFATVGPSNVELDFANLLPNVDYSVQRSTTLLETSWSDIGSLEPSATSDTFTDSSPVGGDKSFYRLLPFLP